MISFSLSARVSILSVRQQEDVDFSSSFYLAGALPHVIGEAFYDDVSLTKAAEVGGLSQFDGVLDKPSELLQEELVAAHLPALPQPCTALIWAAVALRKPA